MNNIKNDPLYKKFTSNGNKFPSVIGPDFLKSDFSSELGKNYGALNYDPKLKFEWDKVEFFKQLVKAKSDAFISIISKDIKIFLYMFVSHL